METNNQLATVGTQGITSISLPASLVPYSPARLSSTFSDVRTVEQSLATKSPSLFSLTKKEGSSRREVEKLIMIHLVALDAFLKAKNGLTVEEVQLTAEEIMEKYGQVISMADIHVIFRNAKLGRYGELYNQLSCAKVIKLFDDYQSEKLNAAEEMSRSADERRYADRKVPDNFSLDMLGYTKDEHGIWYIDHAKVQAINDKLAIDEAARRQKKETLEKTKREAQQEYFRWKEHFIKESQKQDNDGRKED